MAFLITIAQLKTTTIIEPVGLEVLSKLQKDMQNLHNQAQNKEQSIAQLDAQINALKGI
ncbi:hypothetical protein [Helicobacter pylori]|uniref:hypothetical protein n=1 Tax=Helicobacter pylori TaxID=210 RepID=UPI000A95C28E|nr:hypothetical protein [Helicobacter pylori]